MNTTHHNHTSLREGHLGGFTLVEALIGIAILVMAVLAPLTIAQSGIQGARVAQQQTTATFLAQEAIEQAKYQIAYNLNTSAADWLSGLTQCASADCEVYAPRTSGSGGTLFRTCSAGCTVYLSAAGTLYRSNIDGTPTPYKRAVRVTEVSAGREAKITVTVTWTGSNGPRTYTVEDYAYRWR